MKNLIINDTTIELTTNQNGIFTDTRAIAKIFGKEHKNVIRDIKLIEDFEEIISQLKIEPSNYKDSRGKIQPMYKLDRDMFSELVMGFTGKEATKWKREYIKAFNLMEKTIIDQQQLLLELKIKAKDKVIEQLSNIVKDYKKITRNDIIYISANGLADRESFTAKGFRKFMRELQLVKQTPKLTYYWTVTKEGLDSNLVIEDENGTPYYNYDICLDLYKEHLENIS